MPCAGFKKTPRSTLGRVEAGGQGQATNRENKPDKANSMTKFLGILAAAVVGSAMGGAIRAGDWCDYPQHCHESWHDYHRGYYDDDDRGYGDDFERRARLLAADCGDFTYRDWLPRRQAYVFWSPSDRSWYYWCDLEMLPALQSLTPTHGGQLRPGNARRACRQLWPAVPTGRPSGLAAPTSRPSGLAAPTSRPLGLAAPAGRPPSLAPATSRSSAPAASTSRPLGLAASTSRPSGLAASTSRPSGLAAPISRPLGLAASTRN